MQINTQSPKSTPTHNQLSCREPLPFGDQRLHGYQATKLLGARVILRFGHLPRLHSGLNAFDA